MIVMEGAVSRQPSVISHQPSARIGMPLDSIGSTKWAAQRKKAQALAAYASSSFDIDRESGFAEG